MKRTTLAPELPLTIDRESTVPLRVQLENELRRAIRSDRLEADTLLPSTRALAADLGLSRGVVVEAYDQLLAEGYLRAERGSATRVAALCRDCGREDAAPAVRPWRYDFRPGLPAPSLFPRADWLCSMRRALNRSSHSDLGYPDPQGALSARAELAAYLNRVRGTSARADRLLFLTGSAQGITLVGQVLRGRGVRRIAVEDPSLKASSAALVAAGLRIVHIPVDDEGLRVELLDRARVGAVLVTPAHQYPTGAVLSPARRAALFAWAKRRDGFIIEDDYDAEYRYDRKPIGTLQGLDPERVVYLGTASKTLSPALRLAWLVSPAGLLQEFVQAKYVADQGSPVLQQLALADFIACGAYDRHLRRTRNVYRRRRDILAEALERHLPGLRVRGCAAGIHLMVDLPAGSDETAIKEELKRQSIRVTGARKYRRADPDQAPPALVLGYGAIDESKIAAGIRQLAAIVGSADGGRRR